MTSGPFVRAAAAVIASGCLLIGCQPTATETFRPVPPELLSGDRALTEVIRFVALGARVANTAGARRAADYLQARLTELGIVPEVDLFSTRQGESKAEFRNVTARIEGADRNRVVVLLSHYDTKSGIGDAFAGANDSGSSTGLLLELARVFRSTPPPCTILLAFVDGEECVVAYGPHDGLHGSRRLAARVGEMRDSGVDVAGVVVLDMIGDRDLHITVPRNCTPTLVQHVFKAARDEQVRNHFSLHDSAVVDDHVPFMDQELPAVNLIDFCFGSAPGLNDYWHTPEDTVDKLSPVSLELVGRVTVRLVNRLAFH